MAIKIWQNNDRNYEILIIHFFCGTSWYTHHSHLTIKQPRNLINWKPRKMQLNNNIDHWGDEKKIPLDLVCKVSQVDKHYKKDTQTIKWFLWLLNYSSRLLLQQKIEKTTFTYLKKSSTSATWSARSSTLSKGTFEDITAAPNYPELISISTRKIQENNKNPNKEPRRANAKRVIKGY